MITGWTVVTDTTAWIGATNPFGLSASDGSFFLDLTNYQAGRAVRRHVANHCDDPGRDLSLTFDLGGSTFWGRPDSLPPALRARCRPSRRRVDR